MWGGGGERKRERVCVCVWPVCLSVCLPVSTHLAVCWSVLFSCLQCDCLPACLSLCCCLSVLVGTMIILLTMILLLRYWCRGEAGELGGVGGGLVMMTTSLTN